MRSKDRISCGISSIQASLKLEQNQILLLDQQFLVGRMSLTAANRNCWSLNSWAAQCAANTKCLSCLRQDAALWAATRIKAGECNPSGYMRHECRIISAGITRTILCIELTPGVNSILRELFSPLLFPLVAEADFVVSATSRKHSVAAWT